MELHIVMPVWGRYFRKLLQDVVLPAHLSPNNLPAIHKDFAVKYRFYTTKADYQALSAEAARLLVRLTDFATIEVVWLPEEVTFSYAPDTGMTSRTTNIRAMDRFDGNKFNLQSYCYYDSIAECDGTGRTAFMIATADAVYADGAFRAIAELLESGKKAVCVTSFDILDKATAEVRSVADSGDGGARGEALIVRPRELVRLALDHLHPSAAESMVDSDRFPTWKHNLNWRVGSEGLVQRWFSMHPLVVVPTQKRHVEVNEQIDGSYLFTVVPDLEHVHVVTDSDEVCVSCLAPADYYYARPQAANRFSVATLAEVLRALEAKLFRHYPAIDYFARHAVRFHAGPLTSEWSAVIEESESVVAAVLEHHGGLPPADPSAVHGVPELAARQSLAVPVL